MLALASLSFVTGNDLYAKCAEPDRIACSSYILGVADAYSGERYPTICIPPSATQGQLADIVEAFLRAHPEKRHFNAAHEVWNALSPVFPCKMSGRKK